LSIKKKVILYLNQNLFDKIEGMKGTEQRSSFLGDLIGKLVSNEPNGLEKMQKRQLSLYLEKEILDKVDEKRRGIKRTAFIEKMLGEKLGN